MASLTLPDPVPDHQYTRYVLLAACPALGVRHGCPIDGCTVCSAANIQRVVVPDLMSIVEHLNDYHNWTREQIADWLDTLDIDLTVRRLPSPRVKLDWLCQHDTYQE